MMTPRTLRRSVAALEGSTALDAAVAVVDPLADRVRASPGGDALRGEWLGHALHPLLTDFPLGCWTAAGLLDMVGGKRARPAAQRLIGLGLLFVPATAASGMADYPSAGEQRVKRVGAVHAIGNTMVACLYLMSWRRRRQGHHLRGVVLGMVGGVLAAGTGYLGGHMSFARGTGVGERGLTPQPSAADADESLVDVAALIDIGAAAAMLQVHRDQIEALVAGELLIPVDGSGQTMRFREADVLAVRLAGG
jgi:uncharacterized membrane protein